MILPTVCLLASVGCFYFYNISGMVHNLYTTTMTLAEVIPMPEPTSEQKKALENGMFLTVSARNMMSGFAATKAINYMSPEEKQKTLNEWIDRYAGALIPEDARPILVELLSVYYMNGKARLSFRAWDYAISFPIYNFNRNARNNNAYPFLVIVLFLMAGLNCMGGILFKEDL